MVDRPAALRKYLAGHWDVVTNQRLNDQQPRLVIDGSAASVEFPGELRDLDCRVLTGVEDL